MPKPNTIVTAHKSNFETLKRAFASGDVALMECQLKATGESVAVICATQPDSLEINFIPFAMFFNGNPYELLNPPDPDGGFQSDPLNTPEVIHRAGECPECGSLQRAFKRGGKCTSTWHDRLPRPADGEGQTE